MTREFDESFEDSGLSDILNKTKTLSKKECKEVYLYMKEKRPSVIFEFGTEYGCSSVAFLKIAKWLNLNIELHSWDIVDRLKYISKNDFNYHLEDITGKEEVEFDKYKPDLVFLDAHPYILTKNIMKICLKRKINFMCHDVSRSIGWDKARFFSKNFSTGFTHPRVAWDLYILMELIDKELIDKDYINNDQVEVRLIRDLYGLGIIKVK